MSFQRRRLPQRAVDRPGCLPLSPRLALLIGLALLGGCATTGGIPADREEAFTYAIARLQAGDHARSAAAAWEYIRGAGPDDPQRHEERPRPAHPGPRRPRPRPDPPPPSGTSRSPRAGDPALLPDAVQSSSRSSRDSPRRRDARPGLPSRRRRAGRIAP
ncbi:MAG: hypothetical protein R3F43_19880 [bacterium]